MPDATTPAEQQGERIDPVEAVRKYLAIDPAFKPLGTTMRGMVDSLAMHAGNKNDVIASLAVKLEASERENAKLRQTIRDREAELLRCRTHENVAAVTLDRQLNPEQRDALKVACDELAKARGERDAAVSSCIDECRARDGQIERLREAAAKGLLLCEALVPVLGARTGYGPTKTLINPLADPCITALRKASDEFAASLSIKD